MPLARVAIIIPTYNRASLVGEAIESSLVQSFRDIEVVVVDDGSTDETREIVTAYGNRVRYLWQPSAGNPCAARNRGIGATMSEFLVFLDSDDLLLPDKVERQVAYLDAHPNCDLVFGDCLILDEHGKEIPGATVYTETGWTGGTGLSDLLCGNFIAVNAPLVRRSALERVGLFDPEVRPEDYDLWLRIAATGKIAGTDDTVGKIRRGPARRSAQQTEIIRGHLRVLANLRERYPEAVEQNRAAYRRRLSQVHLSLGIMLHRRGERSRALAAYRSALRVDPLNVHVFVRLNLLALSPRQLQAIERARVAVSRRQRRRARRETESVVKGR